MLIIRSPVAQVLLKLPQKEGDWISVSVLDFGLGTARARHKTFTEKGVMPASEVILRIDTLCDLGTSLI